MLFSKRIHQKLIMLTFILRFSYSKKNQNSLFYAEISQLLQEEQIIELSHSYLIRAFFSKS